MLSATPITRGLAQLAETGEPPWPPSESDPSGLARWFKRNKYPLLAVATPAPVRLRDDVAFRRELAAEHEWYQTSRREYILVRDAWRAQGIECLMIKPAGNAPSFPHTSDNLDILVPPAQGCAAREILRQLGYVELRNIEEPQKFLFRKFHRGRCVSAIHVHERVAWFVGFMDEAALWARMRPADDDPDVNIPSPEDAILINLAHACYENKVLRLNEVMRVRHALRTAGPRFDWAYLERVATGRGWLDGLAFMMLLHVDVELALHGDSLVPVAQRERFERILRKVPFAWRRLEELRSGPAIDLPLDLNYPFCKRLYYRKIMADPARTLGERWQDAALTLIWGIKLKSGVRPQPGAIVSLSGADGSGKTAHAQAVVEALRLCEIKADYFWSRGGSTGLAGLVGRLRRRLVPARAAAEPADVPVDSLEQRRQRLRSPAARLAWSWTVAADQIATYLVRAWLPARLGRVVVADRYVYDAAVEMDASLPRDARWSRLAIAAMLRLAPRPTHGYVLDLPGERARARKPDEPWHADYEAEREQYRAIASQLGLRVLSTRGSFADANDRLIREVMMTYMADFETWLNALFLANPSQKNTPDIVWARGVAR